MVEILSFQTRARTIDHLGREQIADCPTAISELWKNAYDAYADSVALHIFDGDMPVCALVDDGHGMSRKEFETKWLTVGTESKAINSDIVSESDRDGKSLRPKQGQKGIGRLSCAALGPLLLLVSKRKDTSFVAALLDWRIFENPYLMLHDISIPVIEFDDKSQLLDLMPDLFDKLMGNIWGDGEDGPRDLRIAEAWRLFDEQEISEEKSSTKVAIEKTIINESFSERHFSTWSVWSGESVKGTAMFIADIHDDLKAQLLSDSTHDLDGPEIRARENFLQTLSNFTDPLAETGDTESSKFLNSITAWNGSLQKAIISEDREFGKEDFENLEHILVGQVDEAGFFSGRVKAFGEWHENVIIKPRQAYKTRKDSDFGPFSINVGAYEHEASKTSLPADVHSLLNEQSRRYGGFMIYRDGLRVMPYGREDNDYFEIEKRRTLNAGRYFWSNRRMFGRISISRKQNPNLKDKAGREGLIENRASKLFREIIENILIAVADRYLGGKSEIRKISVEENRERYYEEKANEDRKKLLKKQRSRVRSAIRKNKSDLQDFLGLLINLAEEISQGHHIDSVETTRETKSLVDEYSAKLKTFSLSPLPSNLGTVQDEYREYRQIELSAIDTVKNLESSINAALSKLVTVNDFEIAMGIFNSKAGQLHAQIRKLAKEGREILQQESASFNAIVEERNKAYRIALADSLEDLELKQIPLSVVLEKLDQEFYKQEFENTQRLQTYVTALGNLRDQIDLEGLAISSLNETTKWKEEAARLHQLAQLGITVEIIGHEIEGLDMTINSGLKILEKANLTDRERKAYQDILHSQESLSDKWRFLSPLKLSGDKTRTKITGQAIFDYVMSYFGDAFSQRGITFKVTESFKHISTMEQPARLFPVFINIVNNARYWVNHGNSAEKEIMLDYRDGEIIVADNGPGVERDDFDQLFTLFFTRKQRGGRGIGLYLCKQNLQAAGHSIRYETNDAKKILSGANFVISLKGINSGSTRID